MVQAPQAPRSHTRLLPVRSARLRSASSSVTRGSILRSSRLPFTISATGTSPGPTTRGPVCASVSATPAAVTAEASPVTPAPFRNSLRLTVMGGMITPKHLRPRRWGRRLPAGTEVTGGDGGYRRGRRLPAGTEVTGGDGGYRRGRRLPAGTEVRTTHGRG